MDVNGDGTVGALDLALVAKNSTKNNFLTDTSGNQLGVNATGVWRSTDWGVTKTYLHTF